MREGSHRHNRTVTLGEARELTPPVSAAEAMRRSLQLALFDAVKEADVVAMTAKLKDMALAGDLKAMRLFFQLIVGQGQPGRPMVQQAMIVGAPGQLEAPPPTPLPAGSEDKVVLMEHRAAQGLPLTNDADAPAVPPERPPDRNGHPHTSRQKG